MTRQAHRHTDLLREGEFYCCERGDRYDPARPLLMHVDPTCPACREEYERIRWPNGRPAAALSRRKAQEIYR